MRRIISYINHILFIKKKLIFFIKWVRPNPLFNIKITFHNFYINFNLMSKKRYHNDICQRWSAIRYFIIYEME